MKRLKGSLEDPNSGKWENAGNGHASHPKGVMSWTLNLSQSHTPKSFAKIEQFSVLQR